MGKLTLTFCNKKLESGDYGDGENLYLRVSPTGKKSWVFRKMIDGKLSVRSLGAYRDNTRESEGSGLSLYEARDAVRDQVKIVGGDRVKKAVGLNFNDYCNKYIEAHRASWSNSKHVAQWANTMRDYALPVIGNLTVSSITTKHMRMILDPIWSVKNETASRVRQRIEKIIDYGLFHEEINQSNPARWKGCLELVYHKRTPPTHFHAIDYLKLPLVIPKAMDSGTLSGLCLTWIALHACRSNEARGAFWSEIDLARKVWKIPGSRTKTRREHVSPVGDQGIEVLERIEQLIGRDGLIFSIDHVALSDVALSKYFKRLAEDRAVTVHGLRSCFRDWAAEQTDYPREVAESQLAHSLGAVEAAYRRSDLLEKRRLLMAKWESFLFEKV